MVLLPTKLPYAPSANLPLGDALPIMGSMTYHTLITIISGACTILACIICAGLAATHLFKFRIPDEQRQYVHDEHLK
jgi:hypothetical protein